MDLRPDQQEESRAWDKKPSQASQASEVIYLKEKSTTTIFTALHNS